MSQHKHTPENWYIKDGSYIACKYVPKTQNERAISGDKPAEIFIADIIRMENAPLLIAAPDLLAALEAIVFQVQQGKVLERDACITQARKAIAKAKGGA